MSLTWEDRLEDCWNNSEKSETATASKVQEKSCLLYYGLYGHMTYEKYNEVISCGHNAAFSSPPIMHCSSFRK